MVLAKVARRMKKLLRNDGRLQPCVAERIDQRLAARTVGLGAARSEVDHVVESFMCSVKAGVPSAKQRPHVRRDQGIRHAVENGFALNIAKVQRASNMEINDLMVADERANARLTRGVFKTHKFHRSLRISNGNLRILLREARLVHRQDVSAAGQSFGGVIKEIRRYTIQSGCEIHNRKSGSLITRGKRDMR